MKLRWRHSWTGRFPIPPLLRPSRKPWSECRFGNLLQWAKCLKLIGNREQRLGHLSPELPEAGQRTKSQPKRRWARNTYIRYGFPTKYLVVSGSDRGDDPHPRIGPLLGRAALRCKSGNLQLRYFGWRLFGFRRGETDFRFSAILFGGYVEDEKLGGEQPGEEAQDPRKEIAKPRWQRMFIAFAGPAINLVLAVALLTGLFMYRFPKVPNPSSPVIGMLTPDGAAAKAGVKVGDKIVQIDDTVDPTWEQIGPKELTSAGASHSGLGREKWRAPSSDASYSRRETGNWRGGLGARDANPHRRIRDRCGRREECRN